MSIKTITTIAAASGAILTGIGVPTAHAATPPAFGCHTTVAVGWGDTDGESGALLKTGSRTVRATATEGIQGTYRAVTAAPVTAHTASTTLIVNVDWITVPTLRPVGGQWVLTVPVGSHAATAKQVSTLVNARFGACAAPSDTAPGTNVSHRAGHSQAMVADRVGTGTAHRGTWARYEWRTGAGWTRVGSTTTTAIFGSRGVVVASQRHVGSNQTPAGAFTITEVFSRSAAPAGESMRWHRITRCSGWSHSTNSWTESCRAPGAGGTTHLGALVNSGAVINFNRSPYVPSRGHGIWLHYARSYTNGCVGLNSQVELASTVRWMRASAHPVIVVKA